MLTDISSATLRKMVKLSERKEALMSQIQELDRQMMRLQEPARGQFIEISAPSKKLSTNAKGKRAVPRVKRGVLKAKIVSALRAAGRRGLTIGELSTKLGAKTANLYVWFNGTGRRTPGIKKIGPAKYRLQ